MAEPSETPRAEAPPLASRSTGIRRRRRADSIATVQGRVLDPATALVVDNVVPDRPCTSDPG